MRIDRSCSGSRLTRAVIAFVAGAGLLLVGCSPPGGKSPTGFGVVVPGGHGDTSGYVADLEATWARIDVNLGRSQPDARWYLAKGIDVVLTISNRDASNAQTTFGTPTQWPRAGFPYVSADRYSTQVRAVLEPLVPYVSAGRAVWVQCENEVMDASLAGSVFWRGTTAQYLALERTCHDTTKSVDPAMQVVLGSFSSEGLAEAAAGSGPGAALHERFYETLLHDAAYDAADLHFYGCVSDIASKVDWVDGHRAKNTVWISTENGGPDPRCPSTPQTWDQDPAAFDRAEAAQVPARLRACADDGGKVCLWFSLFDLTGGGPNFAHLGLLDGTTSPPREKPAYAAFRTFAGGHT